ncbi:hypothetical protein M433DRAFT_422517 [Acidomyces richmondensis BFW]|nr:hypothetical protein M433DRAFT_422517 [Acidomyces richmondensis BFW]
MGVILLSVVLGWGQLLLSPLHNARHCHTYSMRGAKGTTFCLPSSLLLVEPFALLLSAQTVVSMHLFHREF